MRAVGRDPTGQALVASDGAATHLHPSGFDPARVESFPRLVLPEMEQAFEELHGCIIRRPAPVCEVRKEFLAIALCALDDAITARKSHPLTLSSELHVAADEIEACGAGNEAATMRAASARLVLMYDALATIEDVWTLPAPEQHPEQKWHCRHDEWLYAATVVAGRAIAIEAATAGETCNRLDPKGESAGPQDIAQPHSGEI